MAFFLLKLIPPRPSFPFDMTDAEREVMRKHGEYWSVFCDKGSAIVVGPVIDPEGPWGVAIVELENDAAARAIAENDPAVKADIGARVLISPMPSAMLRKAVAV